MGLKYYEKYSRWNALELASMVIICRLAMSARHVERVQDHLTLYGCPKPLCTKLENVVLTTSKVVLLMVVLKLVRKPLDVIVRLVESSG